MARIADSSLEAIRQRIDIAELVKEYVPSLKRAGRSFKACCPFHQEKTPSFMVNPERQIFHCFGCQEGGDIFSFLMKMESLTFSEAVQKLAQRAGVAIAPAAESLSPREKESLKLREALAFARDFYRQVLEKSPEAGAARRYLDGRGLDAATREAFGLGFALADGGSFLEAALRKSFAPEILAKAGLVALLEERGRYRDFFRGRILYPIRSARGDVVGFGARAMGDAMPKYLNSPDTPVFSKGRVLYGLYEGLPEMRKARKAVLLEGYMDVLAAHQFGIRWACAPLGTAVTPDHAALLRRYADQVTVVFDPDAAGASAALRGAGILLEQGVDVRIATVPEGLDPDEFLHKRGLEAFQQCLDRAKDLPDFQTDLALSKTRTLDAQAKSRITDAVLETIRKAQDEVLKSEWVRRLAGRLAVREDALHLKLRRLSSGASAERADGVLPAKARPESLPPAERAMLQAILRRPELALEESAVAEDDLQHPAAKRIFACIREKLPKPPLPKGERVMGESLLRGLAPEDVSLALALLVQDMGEGDPEAILRRLVEESRLVRRCRELEPKVLAMQQGRLPADAGAVQEYQGLLKRLSDLRLLDRIHS